jgi:hypothetical protein
LKQGFVIRNALSDKEVFNTGSQRDSREGKGRLDLLPPLAILRVAKVYEQGAVKYGDRNWELGQPQDRFMDSALRHLFQWQAGKRDEDHLAHAAFNILAMIHFDEKDRVDFCEGCPCPNECAAMCPELGRACDQPEEVSDTGIGLVPERTRDYPFYLGEIRSNYLGVGSSVSVPKRNEDPYGVRKLSEDV